MTHSSRVGTALLLGLFGAHCASSQGSGSSLGDSGAAGASSSGGQANTTGGHANATGGSSTGGHANATGGSNTGGTAGSGAEAVSVTVTPKTGTVAVAKTLGLVASVVGSSDTAVDWSVVETSGCGSVSSSGTYTAPASVPDPAFCHVRATSHADPTRSDTATLTISGGASGTPGVWEDVTPSGITLDPAAFSHNNFGVQDVVADPVRKTDFYAFTTYQGVWRSTDYGMTWTKASAAGSTLESGRQWAAAIDNDLNRDPTTAPTLYTTNGWSTGGFFKSTDWGKNWVQASAAGDVYSIDMDPYDNQHLIIGFHEATGMAESTDGGATWKQIATQGSGNSIYPFFIDTGDPATTRTTWIELPQDFVGGSTYRTTNGGAAWTQVGTFVHPHGTCQIFNAGGGVVYVAGSQGVVQSKDYAVTFTQVSQPYEGAIIGTPNVLYTSSGVNFGPGYPPFRTAPRNPGTQWSDMTLPTGMFHGPKRFATTYDGSHYVLIQGSWMSGIWRYVEP